MLTDRTIVLLLAELLLLIAAVTAMVGSAFTHSRRVWLGVTVAAFAAAGLLLAQQDFGLWSGGNLSVGQVAGTSGPLFVDVFGYVLRWLALVAGLMLVLVAGRAGADHLSGEYLGCLTLVTVGSMLASAAADLVLLFLALELISIPTYVLLFLGRRDWASVEATTKYFFLSILSSALLLYGFSFLYGAAGSTQLVEIQSHLDAAASAGEAGLLPLVIVLVFAGLAFKIAAVPFHFYAPDVYQGTTNANAGLLAVAPKIVGMVALTRVLVVAVPAVTSFGWQLALVMSLLTMTLGNLCALWQKNIRRLLAYSSIAHAGYMLIGLAVALAAEDGTQVAYDGVGAMLLYLVFYVFAALGSFAALVFLGSQEHEVNDVSELAGLARHYPLVAGALAVFMFSLSGIPPLAGFWGKLTLLTSAVSLGMSDMVASNWFVLLAVVGVINAAIAAAYYLRIVSAMFFQTSERSPRATGGYGARVVSVFCALVIVIAGVWPVRVVQWTRNAAQSTRPAAVVPVETASVLPQVDADVVLTGGPP